jgi:starch phosphorylase
MAHLACVGSHAINGVAALHSELLKADVLKDFYAMWPEKFSNKTNGVTPRRWIALSNPGLTQLVSEVIGDDWVRDLANLRRLEAFAQDPGFLERWQKIKHANKATLAKAIRSRTGISVDPNSLFDVQVKRIHEYKRQHLNILHVIALYHRLRSDPQHDMQPRTFIFGGKAAPGYYIAKLIIKLITSVGDIVNKDPAVKGRIKVVYWPNFSVKTGQHIYPAADLSEQISTAGMEASGTGNMKFALNGALTIGTLDGANIEIRDRVGSDNIVIFGLTADEVAANRAQGHQPRAVIEGSRELSQALAAIASGVFSPDDPQRFAGLIGGLYDHDWFMVAADFDSYATAQRTVDWRWNDPAGWNAAAVRNVAHMGWFSSDRTIREYAKDIWGLL